MKFDNETIAEKLGCNNNMVRATAVVRYVAGVIHRERERIGHILERHLDSTVINELICDDSQDEKVFQWGPPSQSK